MRLDEARLGRDRFEIVEHRIEPLHVTDLQHAVFFLRQLHQFRRLLLGSVVECLLAAGIAVDFASIRIRFDDTSVFHVPRLDNFMRFAGVLTASVGVAPAAPALASLRGSLTALWPDLLAVLDLPIGDTLTEDDGAIDVTFADGVLTVRFDLSAD